MKFSVAIRDFIETDSEPNQLAVIGQDQELTWKEFQEEVNLLSDKFIAATDNPEFPVVIYGHKSAHMIVAIYAMMKLQIPYIPVDVIYPEDRVKKIIGASGAQIIINTTNEPLSFEGINEWSRSSSDWRYTKRIEVSRIKEKEEDPLIYIIFTSGSTGEPKGVRISTEAVESFTRWMTSADFGFTADDVFINTAVLSFDLSVFEVMTFGAIGGTILLNSKKVSSDPKLFLPRIKKYQASVWVSTPSYAFTYSRLGEEQQMNSVHTFLFCGEVLPQTLAKNLLKNFPQAKVLNTYGPTEATVATSIVEITPEIADKYASLPVGHCRSEGELIIENGEIIIIGPHVSKGYVNNEALNQLKFTEINGKRAFRTGDEGYLENGMLYFNGRNDDLVKLHGYRIELNEITSALTELPYIFQAETIALKRDNIVKKIVSLACLREGVELDKERIKEDLAKNLPVYMIPSDIKLVTEIPLNQNGKADKKLLQDLYLKRG